MQMKMKRMIVILGVLAMSAAIVHADTLTDGFNDGLSSSRWGVAYQVDAAGAPWTLTAPDSTGGLRISKPGDTDLNTPIVSIGVVSKFVLDGDLSVWVDFDLHTFPGSTAGWNEVGLTVGQFSVLRFTSGFTQYAEGFSDYHPAEQPLSPVIDNTMTGRFGVTRQGQTMGAWIDRGSGPVLIGSLTGSQLAGPQEITLWGNQWPSDTRPHTAFDVTFDNISIVAGSITPEPATLSLLALGGLAVLRRRRLRQR
jgi:PEP-CTERM motif